MVVPSSLPLRTVSIATPGQLPVAARSQRQANSTRLSNVVAGTGRCVLRESSAQTEATATTQPGTAG
ncbi:hypothetical protein [Nocardia sp. NPDC049707]|uniref:hypothetical protein n=1 Tax=Nocardia sp. NPDC049707 TaxID=3154735 RepID=UPI003431D9EE